MTRLWEYLPVVNQKQRQRRVVIAFMALIFTNSFSRWSNKCQHFASFPVCTPSILSAVSAPMPLTSTPADRARRVNRENSPQSPAQSAMNTVFLNPGTGSAIDATLSLHHAKKRQRRRQSSTHRSPAPSPVSLFPARAGCKLISSSSVMLSGEHHHVEALEPGASAGSASSAAAYLAR